MRPAIHSQLEVVIVELSKSRQFSEVWWAAWPGPLRSWCCGSAPEVRMVCKSYQDTRHKLLSQSVYVCSQ